VGKMANREPAIPEHETPASAPSALIAFVRLLARHLAQEALATAQAAAASEPDHSDPEDMHEAEV
jgi:hypothetical protein